MKVGETYTGDELCELCGADEETHYVAVVGEKATVVAVDVGNDNYQITHLSGGLCPYCKKEIDTIYTSRTVHLKRKDGKWVEEQHDKHCTYQCPECYEEFSPEDLDKLGIPEGIR